MRVVTEGRNRLVIVTRRYAFKLPSMRTWRDFLFGLLNNMNERDWSKDPLHCPVLWAAPLGLLIVMPACRILTEEEFAIWQLDIPDDCRAERKASSWGMLNGRLVAVDYGW